MTKLNLDSLKQKLAEFAGKFVDPVTDNPKFTWEELDALYDYAEMGYFAAYSNQENKAPADLVGNNRYKWLFWKYGYQVFEDELRMEDEAP